MKPFGLWILSLYFLFISSSGLAFFQNESNSMILGKWKFVGYFYAGKFQEPPNPNLVLTFEFFENGVDLLHWHRTNEEGLCERKGNYTYDDQKLSDEVVWLNPDNVIECGRDPDMVLGKKLITPLRRKDDRLYMDLPLSEETLTYVWAKD